MDPITINIIYQLVTGIVIPVLGYFVAQFIRTKAATVESAETRAAIEFAMSRLSLTAQTVVAEINQTSKRFTADGKLSEADAKALANIAYQAVLARLPADVSATLNKIYGTEFPSIVTGKIEASVAAAK
jgi:hypothetical protein